MVKSSSTGNGRERLHPPFATLYYIIEMAIRLLPRDVSTKIAAGEVIDRPAAVVKELVENSLDAGSTSVSVTIRAGGVDYMSVVDNGSGIPADEVILAFRRFATSKLETTRDLESIATLGFRGEALPSIATVSRVTMVTRAESEENGTRIEVADGKTLDKHVDAAPKGTSITVRQLFRSFPARLKFLRTAATEGSRIQALVTRYSLAYPGVRFQLTIDGSLAFSSPGSGSLREAIAAVYRAEIGEAMLEIEAYEPEGPDEEAARAQANGMISPPSVTRPNRSQITLFVNGRWIQSRTLTFAVEDAYRGFLMERRFPLAAVNITLPYEDVDVNVHPSKTDVRFHREGLVFSALQRAVRRTLTAYSPVPTLTSVPHPAPPPSHSPPLADAPIVALTPAPNRTARREAPEATAEALAQTSEQTDRHAFPQDMTPRNVLPALRVLGQAQNTYIAAEGPDGVYLIDQHAAHERVLFEEVTARASDSAAEVQGLMEPVPVDLSPAHKALVESQGEVIEWLGFAIEPFGGPTYLLRGVPAALSAGSPAEGLADVLDSMEEGGGYETWGERAAYSIACHGAIRAGKTLSLQEMMELTRQLEACRQPNTCPHGRPTMVHLTTSQLEREFGRT